MRSDVYMHQGPDAQPNAVAVPPPAPVAVRHELSVADVVAQIEKIQELMKRTMKEGVHYGIVPGTSRKDADGQERAKPTLLKAGAEKLCLLFRLDPQYEILPQSVHERDRIRYVIRCVLYHIPTGERVATGIGSCSSRETKYRYVLLPTEEKPSKAEAAHLKALKLGKWRRVDGAWVWHRRVENDNPEDLDNTILKMACKRALVAAVLNGTAASDFFTQDLEDEEEDEEQAETAPPAGDDAAPAPGQAAGPRPRPAGPDDGKQTRLAHLFGLWKQVFGEPKAKTRAEAAALRVERLRRMEQLLGLDRELTSWNDLTDAELAEAESRLKLLRDERAEAAAADAEASEAAVEADEREPGEEG